jgi:hypothetical protein
MKKGRLNNEENINNLNDLSPYKSKQKANQTNDKKFLRILINKPRDEPFPFIQPAIQINNIDKNGSYLQSIVSTPLIKSEISFDGKQNKKPFPSESFTFARGSHSISPPLSPKYLRNSILKSSTSTENSFQEKKIQKTKKYVNSELNQEKLNIIPFKMKKSCFSQTINEGNANQKPKESKLEQDKSGTFSGQKSHSLLTPSNVEILKCNKELLSEDFLTNRKANDESLDKKPIVTNLIFKSPLKETKFNTQIKGTKMLINRQKFDYSNPDSLPEMKEKTEEKEESKRFICELEELMKKNEKTKALSLLRSIEKQNQGKGKLISGKSILKSITPKKLNLATSKRGTRVNYLHNRKLKKAEEDYGGAYGKISNGKMKKKELLSHSQCIEKNSSPSLEYMSYSPHLQHLQKTQNLKYLMKKAYNYSTHTATKPLQNFCPSNLYCSNTASTQEYTDRFSRSGRLCRTQTYSHGNTNNNANCINIAHEFISQTHKKLHKSLPRNKHNHSFHSINVNTPVQKPANPNPPAFRFRKYNIHKQASSKTNSFPLQNSQFINFDSVLTHTEALPVNSQAHSYSNSQVVRNPSGLVNKNKMNQDTPAQNSNVNAKEGLNVSFEGISLPEIPSQSTVQMNQSPEKSINNVKNGSTNAKSEKTNHVCESNQIKLKKNKFGLKKESRSQTPVKKIKNITLEFYMKQMFNNGHPKVLKKINYWPVYDQEQVCWNDEFKEFVQGLPLINSNPQFIQKSLHHQFNKHPYLNKQNTQNNYSNVK